MLEVEHTSFLNRKFNYGDVFRAPCFCIKEKKKIITHFLIENKLR